MSNHVSQAFARRLEKSGVTVAEWAVMREMFDCEETAPSVLAERTGLTRGAISKLIDRLLAKGLATRREAEVDRRFQEVALTAAGRKLVPSLAALADANDEEFFRTLHAREREALITTLKKLALANGLHQMPID
ncbi:MAG TPA: MarR family transcriptional regulator [Acidobacteriaceae bacterium]|nr:MarR family transcriptional regulator [Acidobacteriaceae bacterium]